MRRRRYLEVLGVGATAAFAGCAVNASGTEMESTPTETQTATPTATPTREPEPTTTEEEPEPDVEPGDHPITEYQLAVRDTRSNGYPVWIDEDGRMYGRYEQRVQVSDDWWQTTETVYSFADEDDGYVKMILVSDSGNVVVAVGGRSGDGGRIYRLEEDFSGAELVYQFDYGRQDNSIGHVVYEDIVILSTYALSDFEAGRHANEVILSTDGGVSFERILEAPLNTTDAANLHIHDVEYDPYAERIWVLVGDNGNSQVYWSDDLGTSWETIAEQGAVPMNTQVAAFEDCVVFGSDGCPEGILRWERDGPSDEPEGVDELVRPHVQIESDNPGDGRMEMYARRRWHIREDDGRELCLMPFGYSPMNEEATDSVLLASVDGNVWYELYRTQTREILLTNVMGPLSMDGDRRTIVSDSNHYGGYQIDATVPKFWE